MTDLRTAAQQALEACEQRLPLVGQAAIIDELNNLRAALAQQAEPVQDQRCRVEPRSDGDFVCDCKIGECPGRSAALAQQAEPTQKSLPCPTPTSCREHCCGGWCIPRAALAQERAEPRNQCRSDGRCQYAIDHGAEGMGHCPKGKCVMAQHTQPAEDRDVAQSNFRVMKEMFREQTEPAQQAELVKHQHQWFRTESMESGQMRCIDCGKWGKEQAEPVQMHPSQFAELIKGKETMIGVPVYWSEWPTKE